ncbi:MAG TPA: PIN domain-containing protein [Armatimonadetes bacterium]|nr:PIN domain-containing protein [Armatimonadota bacterium]
MRYLLDASALYPLVLRLREKVLLYASELAVLDLTAYEVGNALWKEHRRGRLRDVEGAAALFERLLGALEKLRVEDIGGVLKVALERGLTFYDASYVCAAEERGLTLVSDDEAILSRYPKAIRVRELVAEVERRPSA